ncbi:TatD family hydrolase [Sulfuriflexus sp.]|uniref:TatD family hydrolase n=1 Tax=Sulfuriflexus sp. TaxID=2015443 RepID=UPI0028CD41BD|nr:TatD family hydrolase [Sulfuriflexus sp.]MDT8404290.1 TatD family hydrolase [Sulfuriflexus sp.]
MQLVDTHCHLDFSAFDEDRAGVLSACRQQGIAQIIIPAVTRSNWANVLGLCAQEKGLHPALGLHPVFTAEHQDDDLVELEGLLARHREQVVAVGEIGLDFFIDNPDREKQSALFEAQLQLARQADLPVIVHVRKAHDQVLGFLQRAGVRGGTAHAFNGSLQQAKKYIDLGFKLGFGGTLTYANASRIQALARQLPLDSIVLETDAPDMVVASHRGQRNSPLYLVEILQALAAVRSESARRLAEQTTMNARTIFSLA